MLAPLATATGLWCASEYFDKEMDADLWWLKDKTNSATAIVPRVSCRLPAIILFGVSLLNPNSWKAAWTACGVVMLLGAFWMPETPIYDVNPSPTCSESCEEHEDEDNLGCRRFSEESSCVFEDEYTMIND